MYFSADIFTDYNRFFSLFPTPVPRYFERVTLKLNDKKRKHSMAKQNEPFEPHGSNGSSHTHYILIICCGAHLLSTDQYIKVL
jgi:hypothetical protein